MEFWCGHNTSQFNKITIKIHHDYENYLAIIYPSGNNLFPQKAFQIKLLNELNQKHCVL